VNIWEKLSGPAHWNSGYSATGPAASGHQTKSGPRQPGYAPSTSAPERVRPGTHSQQLFHLRAGPCFRRTVAVLQCHVAIEGCPTFPLAWHHEKHSIVFHCSFPYHHRSAHRAAPAPPGLASPPIRRGSRRRELKQLGQPSPGPATPLLPPCSLLMLDQAIVKLRGMLEASNAAPLRRRRESR
jgi:hypothetical protein